MTGKHYEISVVIPFHNVETDIFLKGFASMRAQTYGFEKIEWIVVLHNCAPKYKTGIPELLDGLDNVKVIDLENDIHTPSSPRNVGMTAASGDYVGFLDADDSFTPRCIEVALESIKRNHAQIAVFRREYEMENPDAVPFTEIVLWDQIEKEIVIDRENWDNVRMFTGAIGMVTSRIYDRQFLMKHGVFFDEEILFAEDYMFNLTAFGYADRVVYLPQFIGYHYYIHEGSLAQSGARTAEALVAYARGYVRIFDKGIENGFYMNSIISRLCFTLARFLAANTEISMEDRFKIRDLMAPYILQTTMMEPSKIYSARAVKELYDIPRRVILAPEEWASSEKQLLAMGRDTAGSLDGGMAGTLSYILEKNQNTDMGRHYAFWNILTLEDYRRRIPVSTYEDFGPLVQLTTRIGERGIFTSEEIAAYVMHEPVEAVLEGSGHESTDHTADGQLFPVTRRQARANARAFSRLLKGYRTVLLPDAPKGGIIKYNDAVHAGTMAGTVTAMLFSGMYGIQRPNVTSPQELFFSGEDYDTLYLHLLFALKDREVRQLVQPKLSMMLRTFSCIEENWRLICDDIEHGTVSAGNIDPESLPDAVRHGLTPDRDRAKELRSVFREGFDRPLAGRIWKKLQTVYTNAGGKIEDLTLLKRRYLGEIPCLSMYYESCGTILGIGEWRDGRYELKLLSQATFAEFIPEKDQRAASPRVLTKDEIVAGELYELVITSIAGLYRYRTQDLIRITALDQDNIWFEAAHTTAQPPAKRLLRDC